MNCGFPDFSVASVVDGKAAKAFPALPIDRNGPVADADRKILPVPFPRRRSLLGVPTELGYGSTVRLSAGRSLSEPVSRRSRIHG